MRRLDTPVFHLEKVIKAKADQREDFTGPLDLILHFLEKNKIEIRDIPVSFILDQYLDYLNARKQMDLEIASEFVAMASHLVYIKTKMLLSDAREDEPSQEMEDLIRSLERRRQSVAYEKIREAAKHLGERYARGANCLVRGPERRNREEIPLLPQRPEDLARAMDRVLVRAARKRLPPVRVFESVVPKEPYPVERKTAEVLARLLRNGASRLLSLFRGSRSRSEIVATFIALLELCRMRRIRLGGGEGDCLVSAAPGRRKRKPDRRKKNRLHFLRETIKWK